LKGGEDIIYLGVFNVFGLLKTFFEKEKA